MQSFNKNVSAFTSLLLCASMFVGGVMTPHAVVAAETSSTKITVESSNVLHSIKPGLFGVNHRYFVNGVGMWDPVTKSVYAEFDKKLADIGLKSLRYPGGTTANLFWWKRSIGPVEQRLNQVNPYLGNGPEKANFGLDEAMRYSEKHGFDTPYVYNVGNGNPQDAAELVEYLNSPADAAHPWAMKRAQNGHPAPYNIKTFELGNEINFIGQNYWMSGQIVSQDPAVLALNSNSDLKTAYLYANGGTVKFTQQKTGLIDDWRETDPTDASKSDGKPNQVKYAKYAPIDAGSQVEVSIGNNMYNPATGKNDLWQAQNWTQVSNLSETGATYSYELDYTTGAIKFGDGIHGDIPAAGKEIKVTYQTTHAGVGEYYTKMKAVDPTIKIYSSMDQSYAIAALGNTVPYDGVVIHPYIGMKKEPVFGSSMVTPYDPNNVAEYHYATMLDSEAKVQEVKEIAHSSATVSGRNIKPIVTEFGQHDAEYRTYQENGVTKTALLYEGSLGATLQTANMLMHFIDMDLEYALRHSLIDRWFENKSAVPMGLFDTYTFLPSASAYMYKMFTHMSGANKVKSTINNNPVRTVNIDNKDQNINKLMTVASRTDNDLYMIVLNQDATDAVTSVVELSGYKAQSAEVWTLNSDKLEDINTNEKPNTVDIDTSVLAINSNTFNYTYPAHSITAFKFTAAKAAERMDWKDIKGHWAQAQIEEGASKGFVNGYSDGSFLPDHTITRAEFTLMMSRALHLQGKVEDLAFSDANRIPSWALEGISSAVQSGWVTGYEDNTFRPDQPISRAEIVAIIGRALKLSDKNLTNSSFADDADIPSWAKGYVAAAAAKGIVNGLSNDRFAPNERATRAEVVVTVLRMLQASPQ